MNQRATILNFYQFWLGISCQSRPDHYQLLGVARFETDEQVIAAAFDCRRSQLMRVYPGEYEPQWRKLADELIAAKRCLVNPAARLAYNEHLRFREANSPVRPTVEQELTFADELRLEDDSQAVDAANPSSEEQFHAIELPRIEFSEKVALDDLPELPPAAVQESALDLSLFRLADEHAHLIAPGLPVAGIASAPENTHAEVHYVPLPTELVRRQRKRQRAQAKLLTSGVAGAVVATAVILLISQLAEILSKTDDGSKRPTPAVAKVEKNAAPRLPATKNPFDPDANLAGNTRGGAQSFADSSVADTDSNKLDNALRSVRIALAERNIAKADEHLAAAAQAATEHAHLEAVDLHRSLVRHADDFWKSVQTGAASLSGGDELEYDGQPVGIVVESNANKLVVRRDGQTQEFAIPAGITADAAGAIVGRTIKDPAQQNVLLGAFYATDAAGDLAKAESLWQSSGRSMEPLIVLLKRSRM